MSHHAGVSMSHHADSTRAVRWSLNWHARGVVLMLSFISLRSAQNCRMGRSVRPRGHGCKCHKWLAWVGVDSLKDSIRSTLPGSVLRISSKAVYSESPS